MAATRIFCCSLSFFEDTSQLLFTRSLSCCSLYLISCSCYSADLQCLCRLVNHRLTNCKFILDKPQFAKPPSTRCVQRKLANPPTHHAFGEVLRLQNFHWNNHTYRLCPNIATNVFFSHPETPTSTRLQRRFSLVSALHDSLTSFFLLTRNSDFLPGLPSFAFRTA